MLTKEQLEEHRAKLGNWNTITNRVITRADPFFIYGGINSMRDPINVLYYPDFVTSYTTLAKAILLFDEIHFMDRPSIMFGGGRGQFGTIGMDSPIRRFEASLREQGVSLYVHPAPNGPVDAEWYDQIKADVNDPEFLRRFQTGLRTSTTFRGVQIAPGNYAPYGDQDRVGQMMMAVDLATDITHPSPITLFEDADIHPFDLSTSTGRAKCLVKDAVTCSAKMNFALKMGAERGFYPLADSSPYGDLLGAKYARAVSALAPTKTNLLLTDLSFAIFDELISGDRLKQLNMAEVLRYRKESEKEREAFLEHLAILQAKQGNVGADGDYAGAIKNLVETEIKPAVRTFKNQLQTIDEKLFGTIIKGAVGAMSGSTILNLFGDLSWPSILAGTVPAAGYVANAAIDAIVERRAVTRDCSISYVLSLDE